MFARHSPMTDLPPDIGLGARWITRTLAVCAGFRGYLRFLNGDTAYAHYLSHWQTAHHGTGAPLSRGEFFKRETERRWASVRRCC